MKEQNKNKNISFPNKNGIVDLKKIELKRKEEDDDEILKKEKETSIQNKRNFKVKTEPAGPNFADKIPNIPKKPISRPKFPLKKEKKKKGCGTYALGACSIMLLFNLVLLGFLIFYVRKAALELEKKDTNQIVEAINENIGPRTQKIMEDLVEKYIAPALSEQPGQQFQNGFEPNSGVTKDNEESQDEPATDFKVGYPEN